MKNTLNGINNGFDDTEERISKFKDIAITRSQIQREKKILNMDKSSMGCETALTGLIYM